MKAQDEDKYQYDYGTGIQKLKVDFAPMITKFTFTEKILIIFRSKLIDISYDGWGGFNKGVYIPIDENLIMYSGTSSIKDGSWYTGGSNGYLTLKS